MDVTSKETLLGRRWVYFGERLAEDMVVSSLVVNGGDAAPPEVAVAWIDACYFSVTVF